MNWWMPRVVAPLLLTGLGALLGFAVAHTSEAVSWWVASGAVLGFGVTVVWDTWRGQRVLRWLQNRAGEPAPIAAGLWGEAAYRIQKALRLHEKQLEDEQLRLSQFLSAIDASPNGVTLIDGADGVVWCNAMACDHLSLDPVRDRLQRLTNIVREPVFVEAMAQGEVVEPVTFNDPRSTRKLSVVVRRYGPGMRIVLSQDVTAADQSDTMRRQFVANVSHEIRTPLTVLSGALETMASLPLSEVERQRMLTLMKQQADRMQTLVDDLLTLAKLEGSPRPAPDQWSALDPLWLQAKSDGEALSGGRHTLSFQTQERTEFAGNLNEFTSLVSNLLGNAIRYTPSGGHINVSWRVVESGAGELAVSDDGIGIASEHIARITERFYRVDGSRSRDTGGTGLGLSIVKHIVQRHGAELLIESELGAGATFLVRVPAARVRRL